MLTLNQVSLKHQDNWLLKQISLTVAPKQLTVVVGPNGAGKTTLLRLLAGIRSPTTGQVFLNATNLQHYHRCELAQQITFVAQNRVIDYAFAVKDLVMMGRHMYLKRLRSESQRDIYCVENAMKQVDVLHLANRLITTLSGGEQQRVLIARGLASEADIILLDEPTANLDIAHTLDILSLCQRLVAKGKTIVLVLHDLHLAMRYAEQIIVVDEGHVVGIGIPSEVLTNALLMKVFHVKAERLTGTSGTFLVLTK